MTKTILQGSIIQQLRFTRRFRRSCTRKCAFNINRVFRQQIEIHWSFRVMYSIYVLLFQNMMIYQTLFIVMQKALSFSVTSLSGIMCRVDPR